eukprot:2363779-Amphidinium_carterae.1
MVVGKRGRKGRCDVLSSAVGRFLLGRRGIWTEKEELFSAGSEDERTSTANIVTWVASPDSRVSLAWSFKELQAPILDDETWLSDVQPSGASAKGATL